MTEMLVFGSLDSAVRELCGLFAANRSANKVAITCLEDKKAGEMKAFQAMGFC